MKKHLHLFLFMGFLCFSLLSKAQPCDIGNVVINNIKPRLSTATSCEVELDISFTIAKNRGNKFIFIHAWLEPDYPNYFQCQNGAPTIKAAPRAANLAKAFLNIGIDNFGTNAPTILSAYPPDATVPLTTGITLTTEEVTSGGIQLVRVTLRNVVTTLPTSCAGPFTIKADVWSSLAARAQTANCVSCDITIPAVPLTITGNSNCATRTFAASIANTGNTDVVGTYTVYADLNGNRALDAGVDVLVAASTDVRINAGTTTRVTGSVPEIYREENLLLVLVSSGGLVYTGFLPAGSCTITPVTFKSFTADRQNQAVFLKWETALEDNNKGFYVQRNTGNGWSNLVFVNTKAENGNSNALLMYEYSDVNAFQGISQYRLQQVDNDGTSHYSEIRAVRGQQQAAKTVIYPNPSQDGRFNIVFDNAGAKDVWVSDMNGRVLKQWVSVTNSLQVDHLSPGVYTLRIIDVESGLQTTEKVIVNKR